MTASQKQGKEKFATFSLTVIQTMYLQEQHIANLATLNPLTQLCLPNNHHLMKGLEKVLKFSLHFLLTPLNKQFLAKQNGNLYI
jgi:hypothetical protein